MRPQGQERIQDKAAAAKSRLIKGKTEGKTADSIQFAGDTTIFMRT